jgi:tetratricopeptide (TPR) repeat protein
MPWPQVHVSLRCDFRGGPIGAQAVRFLRCWMALVPLIFLVAIATLGQATPRKSQETDQFAGVGSSPESKSEQPDLLVQAKAEANGGSLEKADQAVRSYLGAHPESADAHFLLGLIFFKQGKPRESLSEYTEGAKHRDPGATELKIVALNYVLLADYASADHWLTRSVQSNPKDSQAWYYLGRTKYNENRFEEALSAFQQCLKLDPRNVKAEDNLGLSHQALGQTADALTAFRNAIAWQAQLLKKNSGPFINIGILLLEQNKVEDAVAYLTEAVEISPEEPRAHEQLGKAYSRQNDLPKAQGELERAVSLSPDNAALHFILGQLYRKQGMNEKAKAELDRGAALKASGAKPKTSPPD